MATTTKSSNNTAAATIGSAAQQAAQQAAAEAKAAAEAEKARKEAARKLERERLSNEIKRVETEMSSYRKLVYSLQAGSNRISTQCDTWNNVYKRGMGSRITSEVVVRESYEGVTADVFKSRLSSQNTAMNQTIMVMNALKEDIYSQCRKLENHCSKLNDQLGTLHLSLARI